MESSSLRSSVSGIYMQSNCSLGKNLFLVISLRRILALRRLSGACIGGQIFFPMLCTWFLKVSGCKYIAVHLGHFYSLSVLWMINHR